ncbi:MAG: MarR family transcriptional regulator [Solirubrobacterales bacterium]
MASRPQRQKQLSPSGPPARSTPAASPQPSCGVLFFRISRASTEGLGGALSEVGLRAPEYAILHQLYEAGPISQQALGRALRIHASNLVALIDELEADGSVIRGRDPEDRRRYLLELTDDGLRRLAKAETVARSAEAEMLAPLTAAEQERLRRYLTKMAGHSCAPGDRCGKPPSR